MKKSRITIFVLVLFISNNLYSNGWFVNEDGSFSLKYKDIIIENCYPSIDRQAIHPLTVTINENDNYTITYALEEGIIIIELIQENGLFGISSKLKGIKSTPGWFHPLASGKLSGADRFYKQGFGFAGPSGVFNIPEPVKKMEDLTLKENVWSYDGHLFMGFISPTESSMVFSAYEHKDYMHKSTLYNRQTRFGLIDRHIGDNTILFESGFALEEVNLHEEIIILPDIYISTGNEAYKTFELQAKRIADYNKVKLTHKPAYYFCSWYEFKRDFSHEILNNLMEGIKNNTFNPEFQTIQIDAGYSIHGDWLKSNLELFPSGLKAAVADIKKYGYKAGIWIGPFMAMGNSELVRNHKDWLLKDVDGNPVIGWEKPTETMYVLDTSHPEAFAYLRNVFRTFREMGITVFKTDFMDWGYQDSRKVKRHTPGKTSAQYFNDVLEMIREEIGQESYWLGCISPYQPMIGYVDAIRVSNDVHSVWEESSVINMFQEMVAGQFFNNVLWQNDPDVLYLRNYKNDLKDAEKYSIALFNGIMGGVVNTSCRYHTVTNEYQKLWKFIKPGEEHHVAKVPNWSKPSSPIIAVREYESTRDKAILFINRLDEPIEIEYNLKDLFPSDGISVYEWSPTKTNKIGKKNKLSVRLNPHESSLYFLSVNGEAPEINRGLNTMMK